MESNRNIIPAPLAPKKNPSLTPRELIKYHIENPEEPITDDDIRNLNLKKQRIISFIANEFSRDGN